MDGGMHTHIGKAFYNLLTMAFCQMVQLEMEAIDQYVMSDTKGKQLSIWCLVKRAYQGTAGG